MSEYIKQATDFLIKMSAEIKVIFLDNDKHFDNDKDTRDIYQITLSRGTRKYKFNFGQSIAKSQHYLDKATKRKYTMNGGNLVGGYKVDNLNYLKEYCELIKGEKPTNYDILACLQKYEVGTFENFCDEFGYDTDSRKAKKTYKAIVKEYNGLTALFNEAELDEMREIN